MAQLRTYWKEYNCVRFGKTNRIYASLMNAPVCDDKDQVRYLTHEPGPNGADAELADACC